MTRVRIDAEDGFLRGLRSTGHADYSASGSDIVCAGVSAILYGVLNTLTDGLRLRVKKKVSDGFMEFRIVDQRWNGPGAQAAMKVALIGIGEIQKEYPDHLSLEVRRIGSC